MERRNGGNAKGDSRGEARLYAYTEAVALDLSLRNLPYQRKIIYMYKCISIFVPLSHTLFLSPRHIFAQPLRFSFTFRYISLS